MMRILKAELEYNYKVILFFTVIVNVWLVIAFSIWDSSNTVKEDVTGVMTVAVCVTGPLVSTMIIDRIKTRRDRFHALLPVSVRAVGTARFLVGPFFWVMVAAAFCLTLITVMHATSLTMIFLNFLVMTGIILFFYPVYLMSRDLCYVITRKYKVLGIYNDQIPGILLPLAYFLLLLYFVVLPVKYFGLSIPYRDYLVRIIFSYAGASALVLVGIGLSFLSIVIYERRRSYRE